MYPNQPESRILVELFTVDHRITGYMTSRHARLLDELNAGGSYLMLNGVHTTNLHGPLTQATAIDMLRINKNAVLFVIPHDDEQGGGRRIFSYVQKRKLPLYVIMANFELSGYAHFGTVSLNIRDVLVDLPGVNFTALTEVTVSFLAKPHITMQSPVVGVNKSLIQAVGLINES